MVRSEGGQGGAVLCSGGLDSAVLLADVAGARRLRPSRRGRGQGPRVQSIVPIYVSVGLAWEQEELAMLDRLLAHAAVSRRPADRNPSPRHARRLPADPLGHSRGAAGLRHTR